MNSKPIQKTSSPASSGHQGCLTDQQRSFAEVVGHALADAWGRRWQGRTDSPRVTSQQDAGPSTRTQ